MACASRRSPCPARRLDARREVRDTSCASPRCSRAAATPSRSISPCRSSIPRPPARANRCGSRRLTSSCIAGMHGRLRAKHVCAKPCPRPSLERHRRADARPAKLLHEMLTSWGMRPAAVAAARDAIAAMEAAENRGTPFRLLLVDGYMPEMNGFELVETLRANPRFASATIVMLTSADSDGGAERCHKLGVAAHLLKPIKSRELRTAIARALGQSQAASAAKPSDILEVRSAHPARLLLAEDNLVNQKLAIAVLERWGHSIDVVGDGRAALSAVARERFNLVLMDVQMPTMDGLRATMEIRASEEHTGGHVPIIAMTAHTIAGDRERCLDAGIDGYVGKPFDLEELCTE